MTESKQRIEATKNEMISKIKVFGETAEVNPLCVKRTNKVRHCSICGAEIQPGDFYYMCNNRNFVGDLCSHCPPVQVDGKIYVPSHPIAMEAIRRSVQDRKIKEGDVVTYNGRTYYVRYLTFIGSIPAPFAMLVDTETNRYYQTDDGIFHAVAVVGLRKA